MNESCFQFATNHNSHHDTDIKGVTKSIMNQRDDADMASSGDFIDVMRNLRNSVKADKSSVVTEEMVYVQGMIFLAAGLDSRYLRFTYF